jgi:hypothetical protein
LPRILRDTPEDQPPRTRSDMNARISRALIRCRQSVCVLLCSVVIPYAASAQETVPSMKAKESSQGDAGASGAPKQVAPGFVVIALNLNRGRIDSVLPFDEPFTVEITNLKHPNLLGLSLRFLETRDFADAPTDCVRDKKWRSSVGFTPLGGTPPSALVLVPPLGANTYYRTCVVETYRPDADQAKAIRSLLVDEVDLALRGLGERLRDGSTTAEVSLVQRALLDAARRLPGVSDAQADPGALPDSVTSPSRWLAQRRAIDAVREQDKRRAAHLATIDERRTLVDSAAWRLTAADPHATAPLKLIAESIAVVRRALAASPPELIDLRSAWHAAEVAPHLALLGDSIKAVEALRVAWAAQSKNVSTDAASAVAKRLQDLIDALTAEQDQTRTLQATLAVRTQRLEQLAAAMDRDTPPITTVQLLSASTVADLVTRTRQRVGIDLGLTALPRIGRASPYVGAAFYFSAVNKSVPLSLQSGALWALAKRASIGVGLSTSAISASDRDDLFGGNSLIIDVGYRPWDALRLSGGCMLYRKVTNELTGHSITACEPSVSIGIDDAVKDVFDVLLTKLKLK